MKNSCILASALYSLTVLCATAQDNQKLALLPVTATPTLVKKFANQPSATAVQSTAPKEFDLRGVWKGTTSGKWKQVSLIISRSQDGGYHAQWEFTFSPDQPNSAPSTIESTQFEQNGNHLNVTFFNPVTKIYPVLECDLDPSDRSFSGVWHGVNGRHSSVSLQSVMPFTNDPSEPVPGEMRSPMFPPGGFDEIIHKLDVHLANRVRDEHLFEVMDGGQSKALLPPADQSAADGKYDIKSKSSLEHLKAAGVDYVLETTLEDFQDQTLDYREWISSYRQYSSGSRGSVNYSASANWGWRHGAASYDQQSALETVFSGHGDSGMVQFARETQKLQIIFMEIQCNLYNAKTGELRESGNYSFITNRFYSVESGGHNYLGTGDLYLGAAKAIADSTTLWVVNTLDPIMVIKRDDKNIFINRGLGARLRLGAVYSAFAPGEELYDPVTHHSLGREEVSMGKVTITELHEKFSKATVLSEDKGITNGNILRIWAK